jgi:hypothetical protein
MSERYTMRTATYEPTLYMDNGSILSDEQVLDLLNQLSTVTAQRDAAVEACKNAHALLNRLGGKNHDPEFSELAAAIAAAIAVKEGSYG